MLTPMFSQSLKATLPTIEQALVGRTDAMPINNVHFVNQHPLRAPFPAHLETIVLALGCFWGAERKFWSQAGVYSTAVGYINGITPNPTYDELCTGLTGHAEAVLVVFDPSVITLMQVLKVFWESHNPTQGMRQGNDVGTQYRSGIYTDNAQQQAVAELTKAQYQRCLSAAGFGEITTEILPAPPFYYAEAYHQQYLAKNPQGYCGLGGCAVSFEAIST